MKTFFKFGILATMLSCLFGCAFLCYQSPQYVQLADALTAKTALKLRVQKDLHLVGTGGRMMDDIQMMAMSFDFYHEVDLKTARELLVSVIHEYLFDINNNKEIRPYLHEYPFTAKNVGIRIWIYKPDGSRLPPEQLCYISSIDGELDYYTRDLEKLSPLIICEETYEEALNLTNPQK